MTAVSASRLRCSEHGRLSFSRSPSLNSLTLLLGSALLPLLPCSEQGRLDGCVRAQVGVQVVLDLAWSGIRCLHSKIIMGFTAKVCSFTLLRVGVLLFNLTILLCHRMFNLLGF